MAVNLESFCYCLAVRQGLLLWGYAKLVLSLLVGITFIYLAIKIFGKVPESYEHAVTFLEYVTTTVPELLDLIFTLILITAAHKRNVKMLEVYFFYSVTMLAVYSLVITLTACNMQRFQMLYYMLFHNAWLVALDYYTLAIFGLGNICLQTYLMVLVKSEVFKLREVRKAQLARQKSSSSFRGLRVGLVGMTGTSV